MIELTQLWLPILLSGVAVFFLSFVIWNLAPHHKKDWGKLPDEDRLMDALRDMGAGAGQFTFPFCHSPADMKDPAYLERYAKGPKGFLILRPDGPGSLGANLASSFAFNVVTALLVAYVATMSLTTASDGTTVFRLVMTVSFLANSFAILWSPIWFGRTWGSTLRELFDGLVYGAATGAVFVMLWPS